MRQLRFAHQARADLAEIEESWRDRDDLILAFFKSARDATHFLDRVPDAGSPVEGTLLGKWRIGRTAYLILYRATATELRIMHERRNWRLPS